MYRFIESIQINNGRIIRPEYHLQRIENTLHFHRINLDLNFFADYLDNLHLPGSGKFKWRFVYGSEGIQKESLTEYAPPRIDKIKLVKADDLEYSWKYLDRSYIDRQFRNRGDADDILFVKNGYLTDTSYANVLLWDGTAWYTPDTPLLMGTQRAFLLDQKMVTEQRILAREIFDFKKLKMVNAMLPFEEAPELTIDPNTIV